MGRLFEFADEFEKEYTRSVKRADESDIAFHRTILAATGNEFLENIGNVVETFFVRAAHEMADWQEKSVELTQATHRLIADAFKTRNGCEAWRLMSIHLAPWKQGVPDRGQTSGR